MNRRQMLSGSAGLLGLTALHKLSADDQPNASAPNHHHQPRAKHVIQLFMSGGPSHIDLFDPKPELDRLDGEPIPSSFVEDVHFAMIPQSSEPPRLQRSPFRFERFGQSGIAISELMPNLARVVDQLTVVRSLHSGIFNHDPAVNLLNTGDSRVGRPTMGAWTSYGLGNVSDNLPTYLVLTSGTKRQPLLTSYWSSGFLPTKHQGVEIRNAGDPILFLSNPKSVSRDQRREQLDLIRYMNERQLTKSGDPEISTRIEQYELAYRMQVEAPQLVDFTDESSSTMDEYGADPNVASFARNCVLARRMVEAGVRFIQLYDMGWDSHDSLESSHRRQCLAVDQPIAALIKDLDRRGLLEDTLVIWGGEFGRTPVIQGSGELWGRDHHPHGFTMWMAGGGSRAGAIHGATDEFGFHAVHDKVDVHDLHATVLHLLGIDHHRLVYRHQGRDFRLTDVGGRVVEPLLQ